MFKKFYPDYKLKSIDDIDFGIFKEKNIKYVLLDIDNTLVSYTSPMADDRARAFLARLADCGIKYAFVSNNHRARVEKFAAEFGTFYVYDSGKPLLFGVKRAMRHLGAKKENTALIGDQVFTDVYAGNRAGLITFMVEPIEAKETPFFGLKRKMEKVVLKNYKG